MQYCNAIEANIQAEFGAVSSCSVGTIKAGSVVVPTTIALTGSDSSAATTVQGKLVTALKSSDTSLFGSGYGTVTVDASSVTPGTVSNPEGILPKCLLLHLTSPAPLNLQSDDTVVLQ